MEILVASASIYRQSIYREMIESLGHSVSYANSGIDCVGRMREGRFDLLLLEAPLPWGGSEGVLEVIQAEARWQQLPVILVAVGMGPIDWLQLSRFRIDDVLFRLPTEHDLIRAISAVATRLDDSQRAAAARQEATIG
jgi:two-component system, NarL family, capsular synthesis sensor histidine kinase RcsC